MLPHRDAKGLTGGERGPLLGWLLETMGSCSALLECLESLWQVSMKFQHTKSVVVAGGPRGSTPHCLTATATWPIALNSTFIGWPQMKAQNPGSPQIKHAQTGTRNTYALLSIFLIHPRILCKDFQSGRKILTIRGLVSNLYMALLLT